MPSPMRKVDRPAFSRPPARSATTPGTAVLFDDLPQAQWMLSDRGYDTDWYRDAFSDEGYNGLHSGPKIPPHPHRIRQAALPVPEPYRDYGAPSEALAPRRHSLRSIPERLFSAVALAATVIFWLRSTSLEPGIYSSAGSARARDGRRSLSGHRTSPLPIHRRARPTSRCGRGVSTGSTRSLPTVRSRLVRVRQTGPRYADAAAPGMEGGGDHRQAGIQAGMGTLAMLGDKASPIGPSPV